jgi:hypothetical protein
LRQRLGTLIAATLALWALLFFPARYLGGQEAVFHSLVAAAVCLVPSSLTLAWASRNPARSADQQMLLLLGGTGVRMTFVLGVGLALYLAVSYFQQSSFWVWLLVFYLFTLGLEMVLLRREQAVRE